MIAVVSTKFFICYAITNGYDTRHYVDYIYIYIYKMPYSHNSHMRCYSFLFCNSENLRSGVSNSTKYTVS